TVIATGFEGKPAPIPPGRRPVPQEEQKQQQQQSATDKSNVNLKPFGNQNSNDQLDIPTFLRNRSRNND
ncbi:cell division protein FtsZ, partial [Clostridium perfringens]